MKCRLLVIAGILFLLGSSQGVGQEKHHYIHIKGLSDVLYCTIRKVTPETVSVILNTGAKDFPAQDIQDFGTRKYYILSKKLQEYGDGKEGGEYLISSANKQLAAYLSVFGATGTTLLLGAIGVTLSPLAVVAISGALGITGIILEISSIVDLKKAGVLLTDLEKIKYRGIRIVQ